MLVLIHAAKSMPGPARDFAVDLALEGLISFTSPEAMPRGVIIARASLVGCVRVEGLSPEQLSGQGGWEGVLGDYTAGRYAWLLADVEQLPEYVEAGGKLGLWEGPDL